MRRGTVRNRCISGTPEPSSLSCEASAVIASILLIHCRKNPLNEQVEKSFSLTVPEEFFRTVLVALSFL